jgi:hypothetical protein
MREGGSASLEEFSLMFRFTIAVLVCSFLPLAAHAQTNSPRMAIARSGGPSGGTILSELINKDGNAVRHGLVVIYGPKLQIKEYGVYNLGRCEQLCQFYENGNEFRVQWRDHDGNGSEAIYAPLPEKVIADNVIVADGADIGPIKTQDILCTGRVKAGKCWEGSFLIRELHGFQMDWMLQEYKDGKRISNELFPLKKLGIKLPAEHKGREDWRWTIPDWPKPQAP